MKLMTKELEKRFATVGRQKDVADPIVIARFFHLNSRGTWFATEYDPNNRTFYGYGSINSDHYQEWGYFTLDELESFVDRNPLWIARDESFQEHPVSKVEDNCDMF